MQTVQVSHLKKYFSNIKAVDDISFDINAGEIFGLLGPNGAGKSTTIRCLLHFISPTSGSVWLLGKTVNEASAYIRQDIGYVPSENSLHDNWTGKEHVQLVQSVKGKSPHDSEILQQLDVELHKKVRQLSTGNRQRLAIALAMLAQPKVLILDEPTRGLDPLTQNQVQQMLLDFKAHGGSILLSSHDLTEVEHICDRVALIKEGKLATIERIAAMKNRKLYNIHVIFPQSYNQNDFTSQQMTIVQRSATELTLQVSGDINLFLQHIAKYQVAHITIEHASLEDMFITFYQHNVQHH